MRILILSLRIVVGDDKPDATFFRTGGGSINLRIASKRRRIDGATGSNQLPEFLNSQSSLPNNGAHGAFGDFTMVWNSEAPVRRIDVAKRNVTTPLMVHDLADLFERSDYFATRDAR